ncbi:MAG: hypothetical protein EP343_23595 [Deltaproteobacteria bacterium]|nr:MAG: hypothetical protein EP343_23595 [Deltaproteobacteria bacterium]
MLVLQRLITVALLGGALYVGYAFAKKSKQSPSKAQAVVNKLRAWAKGIRTYSMDTQTVMQQGNKKPKTMGQSKIWGKAGSLMRVNMTIHYNHSSRLGKQYPTHAQSTIVYAPRWQWILLESYQGKKLVSQRGFKVDRSKLRVSGRPFDTGYNIRGLGVSEGLDYPATLLQLLDVYSYKKMKVTSRGKRRLLVLDGTVDEKKFRELLLQTSHKHVPAKYRERSLKMLLSMVRYSQLVVDAKTLVPIEIAQFGAPPNASKKMEKKHVAGPSMRALLRYSNVKINQPLKPALFRFQPPKGVIIRDLTPRLLQQREMLKKRSEKAKREGASTKR